MKWDDYLALLVCAPFIFLFFGFMYFWMSNGTGYFISGIIIIFLVIYGIIKGDDTDV